MNKLQNTTTDVPEHEDLGQPTDPSVDSQSVMGDTYGLNGITANAFGQTGRKSQSPSSSLTTTEDDDDNSDVTLVPPSDPVVQQKMQNSDLPSEEELFGDFRSAGNDTLHDGAPESVVGEQLLGGDMTDPEADDDTLLSSQRVGLRLDEDYDNPKPLDMARDIAAAEAYRRGQGDLDDDRDDE